MLFYGCMIGGNMWQLCSSYIPDHVFQLLLGMGMVCQESSYDNGTEHMAAVVHGVN